MIYTCPFCRTMFEMGGDHGVEPCAPCYRAGHRIDSCGNRTRITIIDGPHRLRSTASPYDMNGLKEFPGE